MRLQSMKKRVATFAATAVISSLGAASLGLSPAAAAVPSAQTTTAFCVNVPAGFGGFTDIATSIHKKPIECIAFAEITTGKTATLYAPSDGVTRGQMASFIARAIDKVNELEKIDFPELPASPPDKFTDDETSVHEANINRLAAAGVVSGKTATVFAPSEIVTRGQMASFISNTQKFLTGGTPLTSTEDYFVDDETSVHEANINGLAAAGVTAGIDSTHYGPSLPVLRANMATFIARYLAALHKAGNIEPLPADVATNATITFTPTTDERRTIAAEPSQADDRIYTATGLAATPHRVT
ncbi:MAG: S-layer homology domain-containing protein, partial [Acidimicrobiales bacterium]